MVINLKDFFEKVYVINLDRRKDRYENFIKELSKFNITGFERVSGVDGKNLTLKKNNLLLGEIGILLTHIEIIKKCQKDGVENVLILEDDVTFTNEIKKIDEYMSSLPKDWDFIYFGGNHTYGKQPLMINDKINKLNYSVGLQCVGINKRMFEPILNLLSLIEKQVDTYYAELHSVCNAYCFNPNIAKQSIGFSDIQNRVVDYSLYFNDEK